MYKKRILLLAVLIMIMMMNGCSNLPKEKFWSLALASTIMERFPEADSYPWRSWCYPQSYMLLGMDKLWKSTGDQKYYDYIMAYVNHHVDDEGNVRRFRGNSMDDIMPGSVIVWAYRQTGEEKYLKAAHRIRRSFDDYPRTSEGLFWHGKGTVGEVWVDGVFMGQMFLVNYGKYIGDSVYCFNEAAHQLIGIADRLRKGDSGLLYHGWDEDKNAPWADPETGLSSDVWSEGLGWYALMIIETLEIFPLDHPQRDELLKIAQELIIGLKQVQDPKTGLWYQVVDKGHLEENWHDASGSAMFLYAIKKAIEIGVVSGNEFEEVTKKAYEGLKTKLQISPVHKLVNVIDACDGLSVQNSYDHYINYTKRTNAKEAVAGALWATWIMEKPSKSL